MQLVGTRHAELRQSIQNLICRGGGTNMYSALCAGTTALMNKDNNVETWIVCLTDGASADNDLLFRQIFPNTPIHYHLIIVGVNLSWNLENQIRLMCNRYDPQNTATTKGFFVRSDANAAGIALAFERVKSAIPVSKTFELDGELSDDDCLYFMSKYLPATIAVSDMISRFFWIRFLFRRVKVFDENHSFNYNETCENLGSTLMVVMLGEVERLLNQNHSKNWIERNYAQLIYDFTKKEKPEFRLLCTAPEEMDADLVSKFNQLELPGFCVPCKAKVAKREVLDKYLSQALNISLQRKDDGSLFLQCIDDTGFILTLDFTIKLLLIHERVECQIPCILEGETGVSKTALTKMYSILRNSALREKAEAWTQSSLESIYEQLKIEGFQVARSDDIYKGLKKACSDNVEVFGERLHDLLCEKIQKRPLFFRDIKCTCSEGQSTCDAPNLLDNFHKFSLLETFFEIQVDSSLGVEDFISAFRTIQTNSRKLKQEDALVVVFLDGT
jgi:hypothetical protein